MDVGTSSSFQCLFPLFKLVFNRIIFNYLFLLTLPSSWMTAQGFLFNTNPLFALLWPCRWCFISCWEWSLQKMLPEVLNSWPPFPQMVKSFCLANHLNVMAFRAPLQLSLEEWELVNTATGSGLVNCNEFPEILILLLFIVHPGEWVKNEKESKISCK